MKNSGNKSPDRRNLLYTKALTPLKIKNPAKASPSLPLSGTTQQLALNMEKEPSQSQGNTPNLKTFSKKPTEIFTYSFVNDSSGKSAPSKVSFASKNLLQKSTTHDDPEPEPDSPGASPTDNLQVVQRSATLAQNFSPLLSKDYITPAKRIRAHELLQNVRSDNCLTRNHAMTRNRLSLGTLSR